MRIQFSGDGPTGPWPDPLMASLVARYEEFCANDEGELTVILVEAGDTLQDLDAASQGQFLGNTWSGLNFGDPGFVPAFESPYAHVTFYELPFIQGDGFSCTLVLVPRHPDIDAELLSLCAQHAVPAPEISP